MGKYVVLPWLPHIYTRAPRRAYIETVDCGENVTNSFYICLCFRALRTLIKYVLNCDRIAIFGGTPPVLIHGRQEYVLFEISM